jgi:hypothetical protein
VVHVARDRDASGRARNARPRDALGRPLPRGEAGVTPLPEELDTDPVAVVAVATSLLDQGLPFQAHEVLEAAWKAAEDPERAAWQGLAQLAVALTHARRGNAEGSRRLRARGEQNLLAGRLPAVVRPVRDRLVADLDALSR